MKQCVQVVVIGMTLSFFACAMGVLASTADGPKMVGNYRPERVGTLWPEQKSADEVRAWASRGGYSETHNLFRPVYFPEQESLYDFDTAIPMAGVIAENGKIAVTARYYMSCPNSLKWMSQAGSSVTFDTDITLIRPAKPGDEWDGLKYLTFLGLFQEAMPGKGVVRSFDVALVDGAGRVVCTKRIYLHKTGWNILHSEPPLPADAWRKGVRIAKIRLTQTAGPAGEFYLDNVMLLLGNPNFPMETKDIGSPVTTIGKVAAFPAPPVNAEEKSGFETIASRFAMPNSGSQIYSEANMEFFRYVHKKWNVKIAGDFANGVSPVYFYVWNRFPVQELCGTLGEMGAEYARTTDGEKAKELEAMICDLVRLVVTYDGTPSPWYHGRGFANGVYFAREALAKAGLLDRAVDRINQQFKVYDTLYGLLPPGARDFSWDSDFLNTCSESYLRTLLMKGATPDAIRDLRQVPVWVDAKALQYHGRTMDGIKADGSWFHHWGNRFDNYGWTGAWRGAANIVYWLSGTPFRVTRATHERMLHMARVRFNCLSRDGYVGTADNMQRLDAMTGFYQLAVSGTPDGKSRTHPEMAGYFMYFAKPDDPRYKEFAAQGITPAKTPQINYTLSYAGVNIHRRDNWQLYTHALAKDIYHSEYRRKGFLFYDIAAMGLLEPGVKNSMQITYGMAITGYGNRNEGGYMPDLAPGYNVSRAPGVTAPAIDCDGASYPVRSQSGSSPFVGGVSMQNGNGLFAVEFDGRKIAGSGWWANAGGAYPKTPAKTFRLKKSFFYFDGDVVCLASGIGSDVLADVQTGLFQEVLNSPEDAVTLSDGRKPAGLTLTSPFWWQVPYRETLTSDNVDWMINNTGTMGIYLAKGQTFTVFKGSQTYGPGTGNIFAAWLEHGTTPTNAGYEYIMSIHPTVEKMETLARGMASGTPLYRVVQRNADAHIVQSARHNTTGYVVFNNSVALPEGGVVVHVDSRCTVMARVDDKTGMDLGVADPDRFADPHNIKVTLNGVWALNSAVVVEGLDAPKVEVAADDKTKTTTVTLRCADGLTTECSLKRIESRGL